LANLFRWILFGSQFLIAILILFSIFPETKNLAALLFSYIWKPIKVIGGGIVNYIPNLFTIIVIVLVFRYLIRFIRYITNQIKEERLKINGFYADWAQPTYRIIRFLLYAFMLAMIYPYLPGADSGEFKGISVFLGLIVSLGSSTVIGNILAGLVITYMRPFKLGDRIKLNDTIGFVVEKSALVTRLRTPKNELVTIPNSFMMSSQTTNYSESARNLGLIIHTEVTIGYDVPWRKVHQLLIEAAKATSGLSCDPEPFVLETALSDFYPVYQINAYVKDAAQLNQLYSALYQNIQDKFMAANVEILSPHYTSFRNGNKSTVPETEGEELHIER
jgi:small-conductance mechanosensitive channel